MITVIYFYRIYIHFLFPIFSQISLIYNAHHIIRTKLAIGLHHAKTQTDISKKKLNFSNIENFLIFSIFIRIDIRFL